MADEVGGEMDGPRHGVLCAEIASGDEQRVSHTSARKGSAQEVPEDEGVALPRPHPLDDVAFSGWRLVA